MNVCSVRDDLLEFDQERDGLVLVARRNSADGDDDDAPEVTAVVTKTRLCITMYDIDHVSHRFAVQPRAQDTAGGGERLGCISRTAETAVAPLTAMNLARWNAVGDMSWVWCATARCVTARLHALP